ncbi:hypothetical protein AT728_06295 [Streptomyces silvensis]|uniref:ATP-grasp domain-containing protein n=2 Tax=Streptomyces silvensis TaxID=1765722 RepID=A0A0W7X716_9ACTN|nr:hypothetical protein AT728_06295 [Streptomyces silvensis]
MIAMSVNPVVLLGNDDDEPDHDVMFTEIARQGGEAIRVHPHELVIEIVNSKPLFLVNGKQVTPALVIGWVYEDDLLLGMNQLETFRLAGIPVVNTAMTLLRGQSKYLNSALMAASDVQHPDVAWGQQVETLHTAADKLGYPLVYKPMMSSLGRGVVRVDNRDDLSGLVAERNPEGDGYRVQNEGFYLQKHIDAGARDIRVMCVNYRAVISYQRTAPTGQWRSNTPGCERVVVELTDEIRDLAERASEAVGGLFTGVDLAKDVHGRLYIYEVNTCPTFFEPSQALGVPPVALTEAGSFLYAASQDFERARQEWRPTVHAHAGR